MRVLKRDSWETEGQARGTVAYHKCYACTDVHSTTSRPTRFKGEYIKKWAHGDVESCAH